ncbi:MAG TPA: biotin transporter BioY [Longimicrobium sp.]|nr:biotin transporter BioY [Longimicrobium sp.]
MGSSTRSNAWTGVEVVPSRTARRVIGVVAFAAATALGAKIALPIPGTPVPFTFQPLFVLLAGAVLGGRLGAASQALYLAAGLAGLPVFAAGGGAAYLLGPTGGYLMAYPLAAFLAGALADRGAFARLGGLLAGLAAIYAGGLAWLAVQGGFTAAVAWGVAPFVLTDLVKVGMALMVSLRVRGRARKLFG